MSAQREYRYDVFISYSHTDRAWVRDTLLRRLEETGLHACIDSRDFLIGTPSLTNMEDAVDASRHTLVVLTPSDIDSEWCECETLLVGTRDPTGRRRKFLPVILEPCSPPGRLGMLSYADFTQPEQYEMEVTRLLAQIHRTAPPPQPFDVSLAPFIAGPPIMHPRHFFGHEQVVRRLFTLLRTHPLQNAAVIGPRRSGKTSLLLYLRNLTRTAMTAPEQLRPEQQAHWLPQPQRYRWIFVDFQDVRLGSRETLLRYLLAHMEIPVPTPCTLENFLEVASHRIRTPTVILLDESCGVGALSRTRLHVLGKSPGARHYAGGRQCGVCAGGECATGPVGVSQWDGITVLQHFWLYGQAAAFVGARSPCLNRECAAAVRTG